MAVPHRKFNRFHVLSAKGYGASTLNSADKWVNIHSEIPIIGQKRISKFPGPDILERYDIFYKGTEDQGWGELSGADKVMSVCLTATLLPPYYNVKPITKINLNRSGPLYRAPDNWDIDFGTGSFTDGVSAQYFDYPHDYYNRCSDQIGLYSNIVVANFPETWKMWHEAWCPFVGNALSYLQSASILTRGMILGISAFTPDESLWGWGDGILMNIQLQYAQIKYFNPCCNSLSRYSGPPAGGFPLIFYGLGFHNDEDEIDEGGSSRFNDTLTYWNDKVDFIYIEDLEGNVVSTLQKDIDGAPGSRDFSVDSNSQITLRSFPALPNGVYQFRLKKVMSLILNPIAEGYAGDWRTDEDGFMRADDRIYFYVGEEEKVTTILSKWKWKKGDAEVFKRYSMIDTRSTLVFYDGKIISISPIVRGVNDKTGIPVFSDFEVVLDNTDREFSKLLAEYYCKNQIVEFFFAYKTDFEINKVSIFQGYVYDHNKPTSVFRVRIRNVLEKYFATRLPKYFCLESEYPDIHPNHVGREMPEVLGVASLTSGSQKGAIEAIYIDIVNHEYLAARGSLHAITEVYKDGVLVAPANYAVVYKDGGRTYLDFTADQGDAKITFNAEGYMYADWDSANGFVENPIYVVLFLLAFLAEFPEDTVDVPSFVALADLYDDLGFGESGYLIVQDDKDASSYLQELLFTYGAKLWVNADGLVEIGKKLISDILTDVLYYQQIDLLNEPDKPMGFDEAVNYARARFGFFPTANYYESATEARRQSSIDFFEKEISPKSPFDFPWTKDSALIAQRLEEELLKLGFGDQAIRFDVSIEKFEDLDILDTFRLQDPYAISLTGEGEEGRYYYAESFSYDMMRGSMTIVGVDLQWLLRQYLLLGNENSLALNWDIATESDRAYAYLCDEITSRFDDDEPGKILIDENIA